MLLCARLIREGAVERTQARVLEFPDVRAEAERRLGEVGLILATSVYSEHVGIRLSPEITGHQAFDSASNLGLKADGCALIVILWARLVLSKRTAIDSRVVPGQNSLLPEERSDQARAFTPEVRLETLVREFGQVLGGRTRIQGLVSQLRRLRFAAGHGDVISPGPLLELGVDGEKMVAFIRSRILPQLERAAQNDAAAPKSAEDQVLGVLRGAGGSVAMKELEKHTGEKAERLRVLLASLEHRGLVYRTGSRGTTRYHVKVT